MKVNVYRMRDRGIQYRKSELSRHGPTTGDLQINVTQDNRLNRMSKTAKVIEGPRPAYLQLFDVQLIWMNEDRFVLSGFEQYKNENDQIIDYMQSWLCLVGVDNKLKTERDWFEETRGPHDRHSR